MAFYVEESLRTTGFVRQTFRQTTRGLQAFAPNTSVDRITFEIQSADRTNTSVPYRALDAPGVVMDRPGLSVESGRLLPATAIDIMTEATRHDIRALALSGDFTPVIRNYIEDRAAEGVRRIANRIELSRAEMFTTGAHTINENGQVYTKTFPNVPAVVNATTSWATTASATPIDDLFSILETARNNGYALRHAIMRSQLISYLLQNAELIASVPAVAGTQPQLTPGLLQSIVQAHTGLTIHRYDYQVDGAHTFGAGAEQDYVILLPDPDPDTLAATEFGVTAEQMELGIDFSGEEPNVVGVIEKTFNPVNVHTLVAALALPVLKDPQALHRLNATP